MNRVKTTTKNLLSILLVFSLVTTTLVGLPCKSEEPPPPADGLNTVTDLNLDAGTLEPLDFKVTQLIEVTDDDGDANSVDVEITTIEVDNLGDAPVSNIDKVEVLNDTDVVKGTQEVTSASFPVEVDVSGFSVADDSSATIKVKFEIANSTSGGELKTRTTIIHDEGTSTNIRQTVDDGTGETILPQKSPVSFRVDKQGNVYADKAFYGEGFETGNADLAEKIDVTEPVEPGDVLCLDPTKPEHYQKCKKPYSSLASGVVSTEPGMTLGNRDTSTKATIALMGTVPVKATTENGPIYSGDLLSTSNKTGYAMVCKERSRCSNAIIGKALESLKKGEGKIHILVVN